MIRPDSQNGRILRVLADGKSHSVTEIHRKAGTMRLNSRVSELRGHGYSIRCDRLEGRRGPSAYRYTLTDTGANGPVRPPEPFSGPPTPEPIPADTHAPRDAENRYEIYALRADERHLLATCATPEAVGVAIVTLGREGELERAAPGVLDSMAEDGERKWLLNPWDGDARW